ncbi:zonular occludens toxin domain-containing protein [Burkholderia vietnamiensis]|uniref:zonular occludens toxin domain-containing protein n=1 Tax=Burkholderia vietnamiensis TaxID=60552 RepID=UPI001CAB5486|nr:zonular occludens toxin domain-containing protein [Burkholderia vietnamiensis]CAG9232315.1 Zot domain-containing protein [Burkholderia vietnamiensis]
MITLITGTPGSGKTLYTVWSLLREQKAGRRIVVDGISGLLIDHVVADEEWMRNWHANCQPNDVIVVDEVQRIWPPVSASVKATEDIEKLHVHRHFGVDFIVITQHPNRMNKTIRDLVGRHVHVRRLFGGRRAMLYEWDHAHNPQSGLRDAVKTVWRYQKKVFELYKSAEMHTKPKAVIPWALFVLPVALLASVALAYVGFKGMNNFGAKKAASPAAASVPVGASGMSAASGVAVGGGAGERVGSAKWRVAGQYSIDGRGYVLLADGAGRFRREASDDFRGETLGVTGTVDGERVASWTGSVGGFSEGSAGGRK